MKKTLVLALFAVLSTSSLWADQLGPNQRWIERVEGSFGIPASSDTASSLNLGFGGGLSVGYRLDEHLSISATSGYYQYDAKNIPAGATGGNLSYVPLEAVFSYNFGEGEFRPYVSFGFGAAFNTYTVNSNVQGNALLANNFEASFFMSPSIGFLEVVSPQAAVFLEARADMDFRATNSLGIPNGTPSVFVPIQAGLAFFVL